jgi:hypothetical protein
MTNSDLQNTTQKTKDRATRTPLKTRGPYNLEKIRSFVMFMQEIIFENCSEEMALLVF